MWFLELLLFSALARKHTEFPMQNYVLRKPESTRGGRSGQGRLRIAGVAAEVSRGAHGLGERDVARACWWPQIFGKPR